MAEPKTPYCLNKLKSEYYEHERDCVQISQEGFSMSVLSIKYPTDFPFGCQYISGTFNVHYLNIRTIPYLIFYIQKYCRLLYKDITGGVVHIRINALTRLVQYYDYIRFLFKSCSKLDINT
jgi:hypothetical protein